MTKQFWKRSKILTLEKIILRSSINKLEASSCYHHQNLRHGKYHQEKMRRVIDDGSILHTAAKTKLD